MQRLKTAREHAFKVLNSYPDYAKSTPGYTAAIIEAFAQFDDEIQAGLSHITMGLRAKHSFLPTVENVVDMARSLVSEKAKRDDYEKRFAGRRVEAISYSPERPLSCLGFYPKLTKALGRDAQRLLKGLDFDQISQAAKLQATQGDEAAKRFLEAFKPIGKAA